jgi:hypothetical protein
MVTMQPLNMLIAMLVEVEAMLIAVAVYPMIFQRKRAS